MGMGRKIAIPALVGMLLFTGVPGANAAPNDGNKIEQSKVVQTSPRSLDFENMVPGTPQTKYITITNVSGKAITITPEMDVSDEYDAYLGSRMQICDEVDNCVDVTPELELNMPADGSERLAVTIDMIQKPPAELSKITLTGGIKVTGKVYPDDPNSEEVQEIVPDGTLPDTGSNPMIFKIIGGAGLLVILGYLLLKFSRKSNQDATEAQ